MSSFKFELDREGVRELLKSEEMHSIINDCAQEILGRLSDGYEMKSGETEQRAKASVYAESIKARRDNSKNNTLLKALGGGTV